MTRSRTPISLAVAATAALAVATVGATTSLDDGVGAASVGEVRPVGPAVEPAISDEELDSLKALDPAPAPEPEPEPAPAPAAAPAAPTGSVWDRLAQCESSGNWASTVGTYEGGLQFHPQTWDAYKPGGYPEAAYEATREQQIAVAEDVLADQGWGAWPACSRKLGLR